MTYISFILKLCDLKFGMHVHVVKTLLYFMKPADYRYYTYFMVFRRLNRVGSV